MSAIIYDGPSAFDGQPIMGAITLGSSNSKLTDRPNAEVVQLWILPRDLHPSEAMSSGADASVCGDCPLRPWRDGLKVKRACYVMPMPISSVWRNTDRSRVVTPTEALRGSRARLLRLGAWGDPAALPYDVVSELAGAARKAGIRQRTGYTHTWRITDQRFKHLIMASCEGTLEATEAQRLGWRTFTVTPRPERPAVGAIICPASNEVGRKSTCEKCGLCDGAHAEDERRHNIQIASHASPAAMMWLPGVIQDLITRNAERRQTTLQETPA